MPRPLSPAARRDLADRKSAARPRQLADLAAVVRHRGGKITTDQIHAAACVLSYLHPVADLARAVADWLTAADVAAADVAAWLDSPGWGEVYTSALAAADGYATVYRPPGAEAAEHRDYRPDYSAARLRAVYAVTAEEEDGLGLAAVVSRARAARLARQAERLPQQATAGDRHAEPWVAAGVSRATWHRRRRAVRQAEEAAALATAAGRVRLAACLSLGLVEPAAARLRLAACLSVDLLDSDSLPDPSALIESIYSDRHAPSLTPPPPPPPQHPLFRTAEARRLCALAHRLRLEWQYGTGHPDRPESWWDVPAGRTLTADEAAEFGEAEAAAVAAHERREAVETSQARRKAEERRAAPPPPQAEQQPTDDDRQADDRPARISVGAWSAVPVTLRPRVRLRAGRYFLSGLSPDAAVALAVAEVIREIAVAEAVAEADPTADPEHVRTLSEQQVRRSDALRRPVADDVATVVAALAAERARRAAAQEAAEAAVAAVYPTGTGNRAALVAAVVDILHGWPDTPPHQAVRDAGVRLAERDAERRRAERRVAVERARMAAEDAARAAGVPAADLAAVAATAAEIIVRYGDTPDHAVGEAQAELRWTGARLAAAAGGAATGEWCPPLGEPRPRRAGRARRAWRGCAPVPVPAASGGAAQKKGGEPTAPRP